MKYEFKHIENGNMCNDAAGDHKHMGHRLNKSSYTWKYFQKDYKFFDLGFRMDDWINKPIES